MRQAPSRRNALVGVLAGTALLGLTAGVLGAAALARWAAGRPAAPHWSDLADPDDQVAVDAAATEEADDAPPVSVDLSPVISLIRTTGASWSEPAIAASQG